MDDVAGKVAVVTGGANGIGRGIVEALLEEGVRVVIADVEEPVLERTVAELQDRGDVIGIRTDVSDFDSVESLAASVFGWDHATAATVAGVLGGTLAATAHAAKASTRAAVNTSPVPNARPAPAKVLLRESSSHSWAWKPACRNIV